ncbi:hypothetical protein B0H14DRAFT_3712975 [Mycena olivaceomarginata]|nr:hypothetical protein B0H14DRAFT_3712975 [Mycena olivaceomarginata]
MAVPISRRNRQPRLPGRNILLKIYKGSLENREDFQEQDLLQVSVVGNIDKNETSAALTTSTVRIPTPGSIQLIENYAELYPSNRWMDTETYLQSAQTISEACSAALLDHDYTYFMDEDDKTWLDNTNYQCRVEEQIAQETPSAETDDEIFSRVSISEAEFELVMGLFEILTGPKLQQELPDFSFFKPFFLAPLRPDTFASHVVPAWIRPPSVLSSIAPTIHPHWHQRRSLRGGRKIFPSLNSEEMTTLTRPITRAQNLKVGKGKVGQLQAEESAQHPRRSQRLQPQRAQHIQGRAGKEPACATPDHETKVPVGSGVPETAMQNGTPNAQPSIKHKVSRTRAMKSHMHNHSVTATEQTGASEGAYVVEDEVGRWVDQRGLGRAGRDGVEVEQMCDDPGI